MTEIVVLTPHDARYGFGMAGVAQRCIAAENLEATLHTLLDAGGASLVVVDERLLGAIPETRWQALERNWPGILLTLPAPAGERRDDAGYLGRLLRRVLGYQVRLQR